MNDTEIRERLRDATPSPDDSPGLRPVERRARVLRWRRAGAVVLSAALAIAAIAIPLSGLQHLGEAPVVGPSPATEPATGDGRIGFLEAAGWSDLRANATSVCTTTGQIADADRGYANDAAQDGAIVCIDSAATLAQDGVAFAAWAQSGPYTWSPPNASSRASALPLELDRSRIETQWEGKPDASVSREIISANVDWRTVVVWAYFGRLEPTDEQLATAQSRLNDLFVDAPASLGADVAFAPLDGWTTSITTAPSFSEYGQPATGSIITNTNLPAPDPASVYPPGLTNNQITDLGPEGIAIQAQQLLFTKNPIPAAADYAPATLPLDLSGADVAQGPFEGLGRADISSSTLDATVNGRPIIVQAWFGTRDPSDAVVRQAQRAIDQLVVVPAPPPTHAIDDVGVTMSLPTGWAGILYSYGDGIANLVASTSTADLDMERTRRDLGPGDAAIVLQESDATVELQGWTPLQGPVSIGPYDLCDGCEMLDDGQPPPSGHVLYQDTFTTGGRAFDLFVEFGATPSQAQVDAVNAVLATLRLDPISDASYTPAPGTSRVGPIYDGEDKPEVSATDQDRTLHWDYEHASMTLPEGWTGQSYPVAGLERPISLLAAGSWSFTPGGYCGPINALRELPGDGALVWVDSYGAHAPDGISFEPEPSSVDLTSAETDPSPCFGGAAPYVFRWSIHGRYVVAHAAIGPDASARTVTDAEATLASVAVG